MAQSFLITGGAGFIGLTFTKLMLKETDARITVFDKLTYASHPKEMEKLKGNSRFRFIKGDISSQADIDRAFDESYDVVIHFAAESHVDRSISQAEPFITTNVMGTYRLAEAVLHGKAKKLIHISTDEVYGDLEADDPAFTETTPLSPNNPYSAQQGQLRSPRSVLCQNPSASCHYHKMQQQLRSLSAPGKNDSDHHPTRGKRPAGSAVR